MPLETNQLYEFGDFQLDLGEGVLFHKKTPLSLTPKAFHLLKILVRNHGHIVEKDALISEIWADSFVEDGNLAVNVAMLRKALGDNAANPLYIETVARRGYRFIARVSEASRDDRSNTVIQKKGRPKSRWIVPALVLPILIFTLLAVGAWQGSFGPFSTPSAPIVSQPFRSVQLTSTGNAGSAAISPDGKYVAYTDRNNGKWSIWLRQLVTSENIRIAPPSDEPYGGLTFSRHGDLLYFVRGEPGKKLDLYRVSAFGGVPVKLLERIEGPISISPDNKRLSFVRCLYEAVDNCSLFVADVDGQNVQKLLTKARPFRIGDNQFSPDGRYIAFASGQSATGSSELGLSKIDLETGIEAEVTPRKFFNIQSLRWLPGGRDLLLTARDKLADKNSVWKVSAATGEVD